MGRKKKISELNQTNGKDYEVAQRKGNFNSLDELYGYHLSKFKTSSAAEYEGYLKEMNKADMQKECVRIGLLPNDNRNVMHERLMREFRRTTAGNRGPQDPIKMNVSKKALDILSESANRHG